jgi:antitoxin FitA
MEGLSLSEYLLSEIRMVAERPTLTELRERLATRKPVGVSTPPAEIIRKERDHS